MYLFKSGVIAIITVPPRGKQSSSALYVLEGREGTNQDLLRSSLAQPVLGLGRPVFMDLWGFEHTHTHVAYTQISWGKR